MNKKKLVSLCLVLALAITAAIGGTMAYFTDEEEVTNTFTVGNVDITLDEAIVDEYGVPTTDQQGNTRTEEGNNNQVNGEYKIIPGHTYTKDPTVTVEKGSEPSYVRMFVTINEQAALDTIFAPGKPLNEFFLNYDNTKWQYVDVEYDGDEATYEFRYFEVVDARTAVKELTPLFTNIKVPSDLEYDDIKDLNLQIDVVAQAIQADTLTTADAAWDAFDAQ